MLSRAAVVARNICKNYPIYERPQDRLKQMLMRGKRKYYREFVALRNINLSIEKGSSLGILGRNGAGKSTLLQIICGTVAPTSGSVEVNGRVGALLELGTGFNPEFTGRENIYLNGAILGLSKRELSERYDSIVEFADIGDFIEQPVKTYSSGMFIRLAFAVAINIDPEILVIDEALSVGDVQFQAKCFRKFEELRKNNKTIIFVTHSPDQIVRHCTRAIIIESGEIVEDGDPKYISNRYLDMMFGIKKETVSLAESTAYSGKAVETYYSTAAEGDNLPSRPGYNKLEYRWGNKEAEIIDFVISTPTQRCTNHFSSNDTLTMDLTCIFHRKVERPIYALTIKTPDGITVYGTNSRDCNHPPEISPKDAGETVTIRFCLKPRLVTGHYLISLGVVKEANGEIIPLDRRYDVIEIYATNEGKAFGFIDLDMQIEEIGYEAAHKAL
ncbi:MAG: ABC transporter ATP-binding protein [Candidatus Dadabacteria bacterium]|nr:MAG: ABC transporter ATP-binding protein [Candidatus Dadabacteria bacterium]